MLARKHALILGASSTRSLAWGVYTSFLEQDVERVTLSVEPRYVAKIQALVKGRPNTRVVGCDLTSEDSLDSLFQGMGQVDTVVHSVAGASREHMRAESVLDFTRANYLRAMDISAFSLIAVAQRCDFPVGGGSISALTFDHNTTPTYRGMAACKAALETNMRYLALDCGGRGVRVNCISAGPIKTVSSRGIPGFASLSQQAKEESFLGLSVGLEDVGAVASFLASDGARAVSGQIIKVDGGT